jgi:predicted DNA-binding protein (UPF0251 family)
MTRPRKPCRICFCPEYACFTPEGKPENDLEVIEVTPEEAEALRLKNLKNLDQTEAARQMNLSQSTFQRMLSSAYKKVSEALILGKAIKIQKREEKP